MNSHYYISPTAITITPNAENSNPDYVGISVVGGTAIRVKNKLKTNDGGVVDIGYAANLDYRQWTLIGGDTYVGNDHSKALYVFARLNEASDDGVVMLSPINHDVKEGGYLYMKLGELSAPQSNNLRELLSWDTGELDTNQGIDNDKNGDFEKAFSLDSQKITPKLPFFGLKLFANTGIEFGTGGFFKLGDISISSIKDNITGFTSWASESALATTRSIKAYVESFFIRKDIDDETTHVLTMASSVTKNKHSVYNAIEMGDPSDDTKKYVQNVKGSKLYWNGSGWCFDTDYLFVSKKAVFNELEIQKVTHIGGQQILTACGCVIDHVYKSASTYLLFFKKQDADGRVVTNDWKVGDLVYCQSFNVDEGTTQGASNRYYWVKVASVSPLDRTGYTDTEGNRFDPRDFHCVRVIFSSGNYDAPKNNPTTPCIDTTKSSYDVPANGDNIVLLGHVKSDTETDADAAERQGATLLAGAGRWGQALIMWRGIGADPAHPFVMPEPSVQISPQKVSIEADDMRLSSKGKLELSSNQLECTNEEGVKTMWLDDKGNVNIAGILNRASLNIEGALFNYYCQKAQFDDAASYIRNNFSSDNDEFLDRYPDSSWLLPDLFKLDGVITLGYQSTEGDDFYAENMLLPFVLPVAYDTREHFDVCRTVTNNGGTQHLITWNELNAIVGRSITIYNNGGRIDIHYPNLIDRTTYKGTKMIEQYELDTENPYPYERLDNGQALTIEMVCSTVMYKNSSGNPTYGLGIFPKLKNIVTHSTPEHTPEWEE